MSIIFSPCPLHVFLWPVFPILFPRRSPLSQFNHLKFGFPPFISPLHLVSNLFPYLPFLSSHNECSVAFPRRSHLASPATSNLAVLSSFFSELIWLSLLFPTSSSSPLPMCLSLFHSLVLLPQHSPTFSTSVFQLFYFSALSFLLLFLP